MSSYYLWSNYADSLWCLLRCLVTISWCLLTILGTMLSKWNFLQLSFNFWSQSWLTVAVPENFHQLLISSRSSQNLFTSRNLIFSQNWKSDFILTPCGRGCLVIEWAHFAAALPSGIAQKTVFGLGWIKMQGWCWSPRWIFNLSFLNFKKNVFKMKVFTGCTFMQRLASIWMVGSAPNVDLGLGMFWTECWAEWSRLLGWDSLWVCSQWLVFFKPTLRHVMLSQL